MGYAKIIRSFVVVALLALPAAALAQQDRPVSLQLNKLEPNGDSCRAYLVVENGSDSAFRSLQLDLVMFDREGIVTERLAVETAPLPAGKTSVKVFSMSGLDCGQIGRVLLNGILACKDQGGKRDDCLRRISTDSVADVPFIE